MPDWRSIPGWWSEECAAFYRKCVEEAPPEAHFLEVGSWQGRSAASMAEAIRDSGKNIRFDCVDTWQGTPAESDAGHHQRLIKEGQLKLREEFEKNLVRLGLWVLVNPVTGDSEESALQYRDRSLDLVMIDGDHRREMVERDCRAWLPKLRYGGIMAGDDANAENVLAGVRDAGIQPEVNGRIWHWRKRLEVNVSKGCGALTAAVLDPEYENTSLWFGEEIAEEARLVLPRYFQQSGSGLYICECVEPNPEPEDLGERIVICPCDNHHNPGRDWLKRSAFGEDLLFPAFPHNDSRYPWPFLSRTWWPPTPQGGNLVGFCGVIHRPEVRKQAVGALLLATKEVDTRVVSRKNFLGEEVGRRFARGEFLSTLLNCPYQLCVRGAGNYCYRLYETLAAGRIPVFVDTDRKLPWSDSLPWGDMVVYCSPTDEGLSGMGANIQRHAQHHPISEQGPKNRQLWWDYLSPVGWWREWARRQ